MLQIDKEIANNVDSLRAFKPKKSNFKTINFDMIFICLRFINQHNIYELSCTKK